MKRRMAAVLALGITAGLLTQAFAGAGTGSAVAAGTEHDVLEQFTKQFTYLGDTPDLYSADWSNHFAKDEIPTTTTLATSMEGQSIGYWISDLDGDGRDELLNVGMEQGYPAITVYESDGAGAYAAATAHLNDFEHWVIGEYSNFNCFLYEQNGKVYIGAENKGHSGYLADGLFFAFAKLEYANGQLKILFKDHADGSSFNEYMDSPATEDARYKAAGLPFTMGDIIKWDISCTYSGYMSGREMITGLRTKVMYEPTESQLDLYYNGTEKLKDYTRTAFYNLGNTSVENDGSMFRLYNPNNGEHFYTAIAFERSTLISNYWDYEGVAWKAPGSSDTPVYRLYNKYSGEYHYTLNAAEKDMLVGRGWNYEMVGWYSDDAKTIPLYRIYNPKAKGKYEAGSHHYTTSAAEKNYVVQQGWVDEGIGWYGL